MYINSCLSPLAAQPTHSAANPSLLPSDSSLHPPEGTRDRVLVPPTHIRTERKQPKGIVCSTCLTRSCIHVWGRGGEGGGRRSKGEGEGKGVSAVVCIGLSASFCLHIYNFQIASVFIDLLFYSVSKHRRRQLFSASQELGQIPVVIRMNNY